MLELLCEACTSIDILSATYKSIDAPWSRLQSTGRVSQRSCTGSHTVPSTGHCDDVTDEHRGWLAALIRRTWRNKLKNW